MSQATATTAAQPGPLTPEHHHELMLAGERARPIRRAARVASFNAWATGILAALSVPFTLLFFSFSSLLVTAGLAVVAYNEFRGRRQLLAFDPAAAKTLGWNQLGLLGLIIVYCLWSIYTGLNDAGALAAELQSMPDLQASLGSTDQLDSLYRLIVVGLYGTVIVLSIVFQGLNALYYFTRRRHLEAYVRETPAWVIDLERAKHPV